MKTIPLVDMTPVQLRSFRRRALRHNPHCYLCGRRLSQQTATLDHVLPQSKGGNAVPENLRLACAVCNVRKGDRVIQEELTSD